jgi:hypothetical protein
MALTALPASKALANMSGESGEYVCDGGGMKFNPGHYLQFGKDAPPSRLKKAADHPKVTGAVAKVAWKTLEPYEGQYDFSLIDQYLEVLEPKNKQLAFRIFDRDYNQPDYIVQRGGTAIQKVGHESRTIKMWEPWVMDRHLALLKAIAERYDNHPNFEGVITWESLSGVHERQGHGYSCDKFDQQLTRRTREAQSYFKHTIFWSNFTFYCKKEPGIQKMIDIMKQNGGGIAWGDSSPSRVLLGEKVAARNKGAIPVFPNGDTTYLISSESLEDVYRYQSQQIGATHIAWSTHHYNREGKNPRQGDWMDEVYAVIRNHPEMKNKACPSNMKCMTKDKNICKSKRVTLK